MLRLVNVLMHKIYRRLIPIPKKINKLQLRMIYYFDDKLNIPTYTLHPDYVLKYYRPGDETSWADLITISKEFGVWNEDRLRKEIISDLLIGGGVLVTFDNKLIGCAAACNIVSFRPYAVLMNVVVLQEHRNRGLGKVLSSRALGVAHSLKYPGMILQTDDHRRSAIRIYHDLGFEPVMSASSDAQQRWEVIFREEKI
jgi:GNAT superfamily N-acetyltransferase